MIPSSEMIDSTWNALEKAWKNDRTLFIGAMIVILIFVGFLIYSSSSSMKDSQTAFLNAMATRDDKMTESLDRVTTALNKNTEVMIEVKTRIK